MEAEGFIVEVATFEAKPGREDELAERFGRGIEVIRQAPGFRSGRIHRGIEAPNRFVCYFEWDSVGAHMQGFRGGPLFGQWRAELGDAFTLISMEHFTVVART